MVWTGVCRGRRTAATDRQHGRRRGGVDAAGGDEVSDPDGVRRHRGDDLLDGGVTCDAERASAAIPEANAAADEVPQKSAYPPPACVDWLQPGAASVTQLP